MSAATHAGEEAPVAAPAAARVSLSIGGMTCGACAARVERTLNALDGVLAQVNYAAERATVTLRPDVPVHRVIHQVASSGYSAELLDHRLAPAHDELERRIRSLRTRLLAAAALSLPLCDTSIVFSIEPAARFAGWRWLMVALAAPVVSWAAWPFYRAAVRSARHRTTNMDTLVSIGIVVSTVWSLYSIFFLDAGAHHAQRGLAASSGGGVYLDIPAAVTSFLLAGRYFEAWSKRRSADAMRALAAVGARHVVVLDAAGNEHRLAIAQLRAGDRFVVRPGETVAADGQVQSGQAAIDRSVMTGESRPVDVRPGDAVLGGTVALGGRLIVRANEVGEHTQLGHMLRLVERAQNEKAAVQRLADRISGVFVPAVIALALATLLVWQLTGNPLATAAGASLSVLIIACPCALGLATPAALLVASWAGARTGIFFNGYGALEASRQIDTVVLDKTGTLTEAHLRVVACETVEGVEQSELLRLAGAVERASEHPVAHAIAALAEQRCGRLPEVASFHATAGVGAHGSVEGHVVAVARRGGHEHEPPAPALAPAPALVERCRAWERLGRTVVVVSRDGAAIGALALADTMRPSAAGAVEEFKRLGLRCVLLTGDNDTTANAVAASLGIAEVVARALPAAKVDVIRSLQREGRRVAMVGDGVNDAPALAAADLGLAVGSGTDAAINAADLIVMRDDLRFAASAIGLARSTLRTIRRNLAWAFAYNLVAIPLAALGLLDPLIAAGAMALSSSFVVWSSSRLRSAARGPAQWR